MAVARSETRTATPWVRRLAKKASSSLCTLAPRKLSRAPKRVGSGSLRARVKALGWVIRAACHLGKGLAVQVIREVGQKELRKTTVSRRNSCWSQKKVKQNQ